MSPITKVKKALRPTSKLREVEGGVVEHDGQVTASCGCGLERHWLQGPRALGSAERWLARHAHAA
ncbi:hypothetical protein [Nocardioides sp. CFH 31398]|uniref:hypothetical protein n=1 Tax=Nocardioides sp. CFH 31398 TaxID=2919579 RepID=UPI001F0666C1|nr:hypothetical protein [Nocardioides sp. CFH 31398]MCH1865990.1 hypothetical protein [Nocardioides sp. CFH 31398]